MGHRAFVRKGRIMCRRFPIGKMQHRCRRKTPAHDPSFADEGPMSHRLLIPLVATAMLLQTGVGRADAIAGDWCSTDGMRMSIRGEKITIPSGKPIERNYSPHASDYLHPPTPTRPTTSI